MKLNELEDILQKNNIPKESYELNREQDTEVHRIIHCINNWEVYYSERGNKNELKCFSNEDDACDYFYIWLKASIDSLS